MAPSEKAQPIRKTKSAPPDLEAQKMSLIGSYVLAESAKRKLSQEVSRTEYNLHKLIGHANMLDRLEEGIARMEGRGNR
jgi:hypothetical protein